MSAGRKKVPDPRLWSLPVAIADIPETGRPFELAADERTRTALAHALGLRALPRLNATFAVSRRGHDGLHVTGEVSATVGQTCVVSLEPLESEVAEPVDLVFEPPPTAPGPSGAAEGEKELGEGPEPLHGGVVDLGAVATEFLILGIDPYPRKPGAVFAAPAAAQDDAGDHPFAALAALKSRTGGQGT